MTHRDKSVDIAVFTFGETLLTNTNFVKLLPRTARTPIKKDIKTASFPSSVLNGKHYFEKHPIYEGEDMFFVGLFTPYYGSQQNIPICRFGRFAMVTDEKIPFLADSGEIIPQDLYVVETQAFGGNSGSPAFIFKKKWHKYFHTGLPELQNEAYLAGVVKGYFNDWSDLKFRNSAVNAGVLYNDGVAVIVPEYYLYDMIFSKKEMKLRANFERLLRQ
jgi:hypothetical protein